MVSPAGHMARLRNKAVSFFVGFEADETRPQSLLSGDRNIINVAGLRGQMVRTDRSARRACALNSAKQEAPII